MSPVSNSRHVVQSIWKIYRYAVPESLGIMRREGWRELLRQRGWKFFAALLAYYLVRDIVLYVLLPLCVARGLF